MPADIIPIKRLPQSDDGVQALLAKLLAVQGQRVTGTALAMGTRNATTQSAIIDSNGFSGIIAYLRIISVPGTDSIRVTLRGIDPVSGQAFYLTNGPSQTGIGIFSTIIGPGFPVAAALPDQIRIEITHSPSPGGNFEYSVGYCLVP